MSTLKCKMCGGALTYEEGKTVVECEYCGSLNTIPNIGDEKRLQLFDRANRLRSSCDFDKAFGVYEAIVAEYPEEAEAYWGLVLCKYGIEYVDDPATGKKVPTCHRSSFDSIFDDPNFDMVMENCDSFSMEVYRNEAKQIEEIRKGIVEISSREDPYDVFICYKETDDNGDRTIDSTIAQDVYEALTEKKFKVFFSRITLEDKLGQEYEPYIFAALHSAKVMLVFGTSYANYNAVWVKNEWMRYLKMMESDKSKHLIPCFRDIDAYDMPKEFNKLQAQDMGKVGAIQDLVRGVEKLVPKAGKQSVQSSGNDVDSLVSRMNSQLAEGEWHNAILMADNILVSDPRNVSAYMGKLMAEMKVSKESDLGSCATPLEKNDNYNKVMRYAEESVKQQLEQYNAESVKRYASEKKKKRKVIVAVIVPLLAAAIICGYFAITRWVPEAQKRSKYDEAMEMYNGHRYYEAKLAFESLGDYEESVYYSKLMGLIDAGTPEEEAIAFLSTYSSPQIGATCKFGNNTWIIIDKNEAGLLLLSEQIVDRRRFDRSSNDWKGSELRKDLNNEYFTSCFNDYQRSLIKEVDGDKVTLLTIEEANTLDKSTLKCGENWWLQSPGRTKILVANVDSGGLVDESGHSFNNESICVRPAIWIDLGL